MSVGSGSCGSRRVGLASLQLARLTTLADRVSARLDAAGSTMFSPLLSRKKVLFPKQAVELRNHRVILGDGLGLELGQGPFDLCGSQLHRALLRVGGLGS